VLVGAIVVLYFGVANGLAVLKGRRTRMLKESPVARDDREQSHRELAERLLVQSRQARWTFPSSSGRPVPKDTPAWAQRLVDEREALAAAAAWFVNRGEGEAALELVANGWRAWVLARDDANGRAVLGSVLDVPATARPSRSRALALYGDGLLAFRLNALADSRSRNLAALAAARQASDREAEGLALLGLSRLELSDGSGAAAAEHAAAAQALLVEVGEAYGQAPLHMLAQASRLTGRFGDAAAFFEASLSLCRKLGDHGMALIELVNWGHVELRRGNVERAESLFQENVALAGEVDDPYDVALRALSDAAVAAARGNAQRARGLLVEARALLARERVTLASDDQRELDELERRVRE